MKTLTEKDLWNAYISIHNLTSEHKKPFYEPKTYDEMVATKRKIFKYGQKHFGWVS